VLSVDDASWSQLELRDQPIGDLVNPADRQVRSGAVTRRSEPICIYFATRTALFATLIGTDAINGPKDHLRIAPRESEAERRGLNLRRRACPPLRLWPGSGDRYAAGYEGRSGHARRSLRHAPCTDIVPRSLVVLDRSPVKRARISPGSWCKVAAADLRWSTEIL
jgi:hypothetical protein